MGILNYYLTAQSFWLRSLACGHLEIADAALE